MRVAGARADFGFAEPRPSDSDRLYYRAGNLPRLIRQTRERHRAPNGRSARAWPLHPGRGGRMIRAATIIADLIADHGYRACLALMLAIDAAFIGALLADALS